MGSAQTPSNFSADCDAATQAVEFVTSSRLKRGRSMEQMEGLIRKADLILDTKIAQVQRQPMACRPGCDHCCHRVVFSSVLEALAVAAYIEKALSVDRQLALSQRLQRHFAEVGPKMGQGLETLRTPCPMLENGMCSIYELRPLSCRAQFSQSVEPCIQAHNDPIRAFPASAPEEKLGAAAQAGLVAGINANGLWSQQVDFARVVGLALADPAGCTQYLFGKPVFETAAPVIDEPSLDLRPEQATTDRNRDNGPLQQMLRMQVPKGYRNLEEVDTSRDHMEKAFEEFSESRFDLREKFDAISAYNPLSLSYQQRDDRELLSRIGDYLTHEVSAKVLPDFCKPIPKRKREGRLRIGYISMRLGQTSGSYWASGWLKNHSSEVETYAFYLAPTLIPGAEEFEKYADHFFHCPDPVPQVARIIKEQSLDVLIYPDATADGRTIQLATLRLAPVQCAAWGDPETTGLPNIDFFLSSDWMEPENGDTHYREKLVRLPGTGVCYPRPDRIVSGWGKTHFGLDDGPLFTCLQTPAKILPEWDAVFKEICDRTGRPIVFFRYPGSGWQIAQARLNSAGVRALFMPCLNSNQFFDIVSMADATLDTIGWSGGITTLLALQQRRPVVTLPTEFRRGRQSMAFVRAASAPGLIASSPEDYVDLAVDTDRRLSAMQAINPDALFDDAASVIALESFLLETS